MYDTYTATWGARWKGDLAGEEFFNEDRPGAREDQIGSGKKKEEAQINDNF